MVVRMAMTAVWIKVDEGRIVQALQDASEKLDSAVGEVVLDFSSVDRIDVRAVRRMEEFADLAEDKGVDAVLRGVSIGVYKVLKQVKLASRFVFPS
jgi:anti-anti-sigma regulatory factor